jgi:hypothetical protein
VAFFPITARKVTPKALGARLAEGPRPKYQEEKNPMRSSGAQADIGYFGGGMNFF